MVLKEGEPIKLEKVVLSKVITDHTLICITDKAGRTLACAEWYRNSILQYGARYVKPRWKNGQRTLICQLIDIGEEVTVRADKRAKAGAEVRGEHEQRERGADPA